jgi:F-type H+-transporting ATPase subunit delta
MVDGVLDERRAREVAQHIAMSGRRGALSILTAFQRLVRLDLERHTAVVESATPLSATLREQIFADLARTHGQTLATSFAENPALIGGVRIKVGSDVYDGSVRARLAALEARL